MLIQYKAQKGIGLIEVMVSLLILAIGILGYAVMQTQSLQASDDALIQTKSLSLIRETAERIRNNSIESTVVQQYKTLFNGGTPAAVACTNGCSKADIAKNDVRFLKTSASEDSLTINMVSCPGNATGLSRECIIVAWKNTSATVGASPACIQSSGIYNQNSHCLMMEAY